MNTSTHGQHIRFVFVSLRQTMLVTLDILLICTFYINKYSHIFLPMEAEMKLWKSYVFFAHQNSLQLKAIDYCLYVYIWLLPFAFKLRFLFLSFSGIQKWTIRSYLPLNQLFFYSQTTCPQIVSSTNRTCYIA